MIGYPSGGLKVKIFTIDLGQYIYHVDYLNLLQLIINYLKNE
ncbi:MAG: hypothetical protein ACI87N_002100 [Flavobacteriales bacterium]|jgi:hypothetical protein